MKAQSPAFQIYPKDIDSDESCKLMSLEQFGAYMRLLLHSWIEGSIPADHTKLTRLLAVNPAKFKALWPGVAPCFEAHPTEPGRLVQGRLERQRAEQASFRALQAERGARGGKSKAANKRAKPALGSGYDPAVAKRKPKASSSSSTPSSRTLEPPVVPQGGTAAGTNGTPVNGHGHRPGRDIARERIRLESDPLVADIGAYWSEQFKRPTVEIGVLRAAAKALAGGYDPEPIKLVIRTAAIAKAEPHRFPERDPYRWAVGVGKLAPDYLLRVGEPIDRFISAAEAWWRD